MTNPSVFSKQIKQNIGTLKKEVQCREKRVENLLSKSAAPPERQRKTDHKIKGKPRKTHESRREEKICESCRSCKCCAMHCDLLKEPIPCVQTRVIGKDHVHHRIEIPVKVNKLLSFFSNISACFDLREPGTPAGKSMIK